jgi:hypothetical protein
VHAGSLPERWGTAGGLVLLLAGCGSAPAPQVATALPSAGVASVPPSSVALRESDYDKFLPATWPIKLDPKEVARSRGYVRCMRKRGIPEPVADENNVVNEPTDNRLFRIPGYEAVVAACRYLVDDPADNDPANK